MFVVNSSVPHHYLKGLIRHRLLTTLPEFLIQQVWSWVWECAFLKCSHMMLTLVVQRQHFERHGFNLFKSILTYNVGVSRADLKHGAVLRIGHTSKHQSCNWDSIDAKSSNELTTIAKTFPHALYSHVQYLKNEACLWGHKLFLFTNCCTVTFNCFHKFGT